MSSSLCQIEQEDEEAKNTRAYNRRLNCVAILSNYMHCIKISKLASIQLQWEKERGLGHLVAMQKCSHGHVVETLRQLYWCGRVDYDNECKLKLHSTDNFYDLTVFTLVFDLKRCKSVWPDNYEISRFGINGFLLPRIDLNNINSLETTNQWRVAAIVTTETKKSITMVSCLLENSQPLHLDFTVSP